MPFLNMREKGTAACVLNFGTRWRKAISCITRPFYLQGKGLDTYCTGLWMGARPGLDFFALGKNLTLPWNRTSPLELLSL
jgi:hypothetical protein